MSTFTREPGYLYIDTPELRAAHHPKVAGDEFLCFGRWLALDKVTEATLLPEYVYRRKLPVVPTLPANPGSVIDTQLKTLQGYIEDVEDRHERLIVAVRAEVRDPSLSLNVEKIAERLVALEGKFAMHSDGNSLAHESARQRLDRLEARPLPKAVSLRVGDSVEAYGFKGYIIADLREPSKGVWDLLISFTDFFVKHPDGGTGSVFNVPCSEITRL